MYLLKILVKVKGEDVPVFMENEEAGVIATGEITVKDLDSPLEAMSVIEAKERFLKQAVEVNTELLGQIPTSIPPKQWGVHEKHCTKDTCKYGDEDCPVILGLAEGQPEDKITPELEYKYEDAWKKQSRYLNNGIYTISGLYSTDPRELFEMFIKQQEFGTQFE